MDTGWATSTAGIGIGITNIDERDEKRDESKIDLDSLSANYQRNFDETRSVVTPKQWLDLRFIKGDIRDFASC
jgi:hypothetical protein